MRKAESIRQTIAGILITEIGEAHIDTRKAAARIVTMLEEEGNLIVPHIDSNNNSVMSGIISCLSGMIDERDEIRQQGYTDDTWRDYEINEAQLRHLKRTKNLILAERKRREEEEE